MNGQGCGSVPMLKHMWLQLRAFGGLWEKFLETKRWSHPPKPIPQLLSCAAQKTTGFWILTIHF